MDDTVQLSAYAERVKAMMQEATLYCRDWLDEAVRIDYCDDECFYGTGEDSFSEYKIYYEDVDLESDTIYKLVAVNPKDF